MKNKFLNDLLKLNSITMGAKIKKPKTCDGCDIYSDDCDPFVFYKENNNKFGIIVVSRDPNIPRVDKPWMIKHIEYLKNLFSLQIVNPAQFILSLIYDNPTEIKKFSNWFIENTTKQNSKIYWTHMTKCYAWNDKNIANKVFKKCSGYLKAEIEELKPKLIIGLGRDVEDALKRVAGSDYLVVEMKDSLKQINSGNLDKYKNKNTVFILPHPSTASGSYRYVLDEKIIKVEPTNKGMRELELENCNSISLKPLIDFIKDVIRSD
jgi:hypothetical protein